MNLTLPPWDQDGKRALLPELARYPSPLRTLSCADGEIGYPEPASTFITLHGDSAHMPLFIILGKLSDKAIGKMKEAEQRDARAEQIITSAGGSLLGLYYTFGRYDYVSIVELPSAEVLARVTVDIAKGGTTVSTETMTALLPEQMYAMAKGT